MLFCLPWPLPCKIRQNLGCKSFAHYTFNGWLTFMAKVYYAIQTHMPRIVLQDFAQSCSADWGENKNLPAQTRVHPKNAALTFPDSTGLA